MRYSKQLNTPYIFPKRIRISKKNLFSKFLRKILRSDLNSRADLYWINWERISLLNLRMRDYQ